MYLICEIFFMISFMIITAIFISVNILWYAKHNEKQDSFVFLMRLIGFLFVIFYGWYDILLYMDR